MQEFTNPDNVPLASYTWVAPAGITHVLVEMWGAGGGSGFLNAGGSGAYSRSVVAVTPGATYLIFVGGGGVSGPNTGGNGSDSSMNLAGTRLIFAGGGFVIFGGNADPTAALSRSGTDADLAALKGGSAFGAFFCPGPEANLTGRGGDPGNAGHAGYVLLTW
jgi:hypothetical protein